MTQPNRSLYTVPKPQAYELERPTLLRTFAELDETSLIVLNAPSGFSKTTVLAQYARELRQVAWLSLTPECRDAATLLRTVSESLRWQYRLALPLFHRALQNGESKERLARALAKDVNQHEQPVNIVLDAAEQLSDDSAAALLAFAADLGLGHRLAFAGRSENPLPYSGEVGERNVVSLSEQALAFSEAEVGTLLALGGRSLDASVVWQQTRGWPVAVQLIARGVDPEAPNLLAALFKYLPATLQEALLDLCVLDVWRERDAQRLGVTLPQGWRDTLKESGLPLRITSGGECRFHDLSRHLLLAQLQKDPERYREKHRVASVIYEEQGALLSAVAAALAAGEIDRAIDLSYEPVRRWIWRWEWATARQHLALFTEETLSPELRNLYGHSLLQTGDPVAGWRILNQLVAEGQASPLTYVGLALIAVQQGDHANVGKLTEVGLALEPDPLALILLTQLRALSLAGHNWDAAYAAAEQADAIAQMTGHHVLGVMTATAKAYTAQGLTHDSAEDAERALTQTREVLRRKVSDSLNESFSNHAFTALTMVAHLDFQVGESDKSIGLVHKMFGASQREHPYVTPYLLLRLGDHLQEKGEFGGATVHYQRALDLCVAADIKTLTHLCVFALCECFAYLNREAEAQGLLEQLEGGTLPVSPRTFEDPSYFYVTGLLAFRQGAFERAATAFERFVQAAPTLVDYRHRIGLGHAYAAELARRREALQRFHVDTLVYWVEQTQAQWTLGRERDHLEPLFETCVRQAWHSELFDALKAPGIRYQLKLRTLGEVRIKLDGQTLDLYPKARDLLVYLTLYGPAGRAKILRDLWKDQSEASGRSFKVHLSAVRREIERVLEAEIVVYDPMSQLYSISNVVVESDLAQLKRAFTHTSAEVKLAAVRSYRPFLPNVTTLWAEEERQAVEQEVARAAVEVASSLQEDDANTIIELCTLAVTLHHEDDRATRMLSRLATAERHEVRSLAQRVLSETLPRYRLERG